MELFFLGIDPSATSSGITIISSSSNTTHRSLLIKPRKLRDASRLHYISSEIKNFIADTPIQMCVYESPSYGSVHKEFILGEVLGVIKLTLHELNINLVGVPPTQLKKYFTGRGGATKSDMIAAAQRLGCTSNQEDICDSYAAAILCKDLHVGPLLDTRASREVRKALLDNL